jgi:hypothetical protein
MLAFIVASLIWALVVLYAEKHLESNTWGAVVLFPLCGIPALLYLLNEGKKSRSLSDISDTAFQGTFVMVLFGAGAYGGAVLLSLAWYYVRKLF